MRHSRTETFDHTISGLLTNRADLLGEAESIRDKLAAIKNTLKGTLKTKGLGYKQLVGKLGEMGLELNEQGLNNKISRGGFSAALYLQCLDAIETI